jgi:ferredoxin
MELNRRLVLKETVRVYWSGCPNACGQHHVGDIGLQGAKARIGGTMIDAVDIFVGGQLGLSPRLAERVAAKVPCVDLPDTLAELIRRHFPERLRLSADDPTAHVAAVDAAEPDLIQPSGIMPLAVPADEARSVQFEDADGEVRTTTLPTGAILLHRSLDQGIKSSYDCMTGTCGTCRVRIVAGGECLSPPTPAEVELLGDDLTAGYRLACQATRVGKPAESAPSRAVGSETPAI